MPFLCISGFLARFTGRPLDGGKGGTYKKKRFEAVTETEIEKGYGEETNGKMNEGESLSLGQNSSRRSG